MRPEKVEKKDADDAFTAIGVPAEWVEVIRKTGFNTLAALAAVKSRQAPSGSLRIQQEKQTWPSQPPPDNVAAWVTAAAEK